MKIDSEEEKHGQSSAACLVVALVLTVCFMVFTL